MTFGEGGVILVLIDVTFGEGGVILMIFGCSWVILGILTKEVREIRGL